MLAFLLVAHLAAAAENATIPADVELIFAAGEGNATRVKELLDAGASVAHRSDAGETALHVAGIFGDRATVDALLAADPPPDVNAQTFGGEWKKMSVLHWFVFHLHAEIVPLLIAAGANPNLPNDDGLTPLDAAKQLAEGLKAEGDSRYE